MLSITRMVIEVVEAARAAIARRGRPSSRWTGRRWPAPARGAPSRDSARRARRRRRSAPAPAWRRRGGVLLIRAAAVFCANAGAAEASAARHGGQRAGTSSSSFESPLRRRRRRGPGGCDGADDRAPLRPWPRSRPTPRGRALRATRRARWSSTSSPLFTSGAAAIVCDAPRAHRQIAPRARAPTTSSSRGSGFERDAPEVVDRFGDVGCRDHRAACAPAERPAHARRRRGPSHRPSRCGGARGRAPRPHSRKRIGPPTREPASGVARKARRRRALGRDRSRAATARSSTTTRRRLRRSRARHRLLDRRAHVGVDRRSPTRRRPARSAAARTTENRRAWHQSSSTAPGC